jgi:hypothetical protein
MRKKLSLPERSASFSSNVTPHRRRKTKEADMALNRGTVTLYLAEWQKRMIRDCIRVSSKVSKVKVAIIDRRQWVMYRQPVEAIKVGAWNLYLTDEQIKIVMEKAGLRAQVAALNVSPEMLKSGAIVFG